MNDGLGRQIMKNLVRLKHVAIQNTTTTNIKKQKTQKSVS